MTDPSQKWLELRFAEHLERISAGTDLMAEMVRRSREQLAKSRDILMREPPDTFLGRQHYELIPLPRPCPPIERS